MKAVKIEVDSTMKLPKSELTLDEFFAIRSTFSEADFERTSPAITSLTVISGTLWFIQTMGRKLKFRI